MNDYDLSFQKSPDKSQISYFLLCNYIGLFIPVARLESDRLLKHAQSLQLAGDKSHTILPGDFPTKLVAAASFSYKIGGGGKDLATLLAAVLTLSEYWSPGVMKQM